MARTEPNPSSQPRVGAPSLPGRPAVSVIMASYNYARFLAEAIDSVLAQSFSDWELLVVDDGSADGSVEVISRYADADSRIRLVRHPDRANHGLPATLRLGLEHAAGTYVAFLESDDAWAPDCLEKRLARLGETGAGAVFNDIELVNMTGRQNPGDAVLIEGVRKRFAGRAQSFDLQGPLLLGNCIPTFSCMMLRADLLPGASFAPPVPRWLDWWLWVQVAGHTRFAYLNAPCTRWRLHEASYNSKSAPASYWKDAKAMWGGVRKVAGRHAAALGPGYRLLLRMPAAVPLFLRFADMLGQSGVSGLARRVRSKFAGA